MTVETPSLSSFNSLKEDVRKFATAYDWNSASQVIENFVKTNGGIPDKRAFELLGDCYYSHAFQQKTRDEFKQIIQRAKDAYDKVVGDDRCKGRASFCKHWASDIPSERKRILIDECLPSARVQLKSSVNPKILARAHAELLEYLVLACIMASERKEVQDLLQETKLVARSSIQLFQPSNDDTDNENFIPIISTYSLFLCFANGILLGQEEGQRLSGEIFSALENLPKIFSDKLQNSRLEALSYEALGLIIGEFKGDWSTSASTLLKGVKASEKTGDHSLIGKISTEYGHSLGWQAFTLDIANERKQLHEEAIQYLERGIDYLKVAIEPHEINVAFWKITGSLWELSWDADKALEKSEYLNKAIEIGRERETCFADFCPTANDRLVSVLTNKAQLIDDVNERIQLLSEAISVSEKHISRYLALGEQDSFNVGVHLAELGMTKSALADQEKNPQERAALLKEGLSDLKKGVEIALQQSSKPASDLVVARGFEELGDAQAKLYGLSHQREDCNEAIKAYEGAINIRSKQDLFATIAPTSWKIAKLCDAVGEYSKSSNAFGKAARWFKAAATSQKSLQKSFVDLSLYMQAWSKIEDARLLHSKEKYETASQRLREASETLGKTESFKHLTKHYLAFSKMEQGEELSRKESNVEAASNFDEGYSLFEQAKNEIQILAKEEGSAEEEAELDEWTRVSDSRARYCLARKELEDAKTFDKNGEVQESMERYRSAAEALKELEEGAAEHDRGELDALAHLCEAFATMKEAEYSASPELYSEASHLFMQARDSKVRQSFILSCLANAAICRAFEVGMRFKETKDVQLYSQIKKQLGTASQYYEEAGFEIASDWTGATEALFDALAYLAAGEGELDPQKRTQMYHLAEKHLELSARRYGDIGYDKKRQEVLKQLKKARENRELLITPIEALSQSPTVSASPVNFTRDQAVGLERFEVANLTGNISASTESTTIGSPIRIDIDIANVGKTPALLMKLDNVAPSNGFEIDARNNTNGFQNFLIDGNTIALDLRGKRLEYLKSYEISIHLIGKTRGNFQLNPRILFVDELGKYRSYEFEPQNIQVTSIERKLAAIMFTDMAGYTALGQRNESLSIALVNEQRKLLRPIFKKHNGREVKTIGDAFLVEFASSLDAARCAYDIQRATREFNISLSEDKRIILRVGVHIGDVVASDDGDISGDAVNVASRIEPLAEHGGVCITRQVYDNIQNKFDLKLESLGLKTLKNVSSEIEVYKMVMPWE